MNGTLLRTLLMAAIVAVAAGGLPAADDLVQAAADKASEESKDTPVGSVKDPVEQAFALPRGVVLRSDQLEAFKKMRKELEPKLRKALKRVSDAATDVDKLKATKEVIKIREQIRQQIRSILNMPPPDALKNNYQQRNSGGGYHHGHRGRITYRFVPAPQPMPGGGGKGRLPIMPPVPQ